MTSIIAKQQFDTPARNRLEQFLARERGPGDDVVLALTPDASTREYFRIRWGIGTAVAAVYPESIDPETHSYLDVTRLFVEADLPVPAILKVDTEAGIVVQEDLGDRQLKEAMAAADAAGADDLQESAIRLIARIQAATSLAFENNSIAGKLAFDFEKLSWELDFFLKHYFLQLKEWSFDPGEEDAIHEELHSVARELAERPRVLCHRDFHVANLMVDSKGNLRIVDYQDARMGPASYDLVSLLLDRRTSPPSVAEIRNQRLLFLEERRLVGLPALDPDEFAREFRLMAIQRGLKAVGTFANQTVCGRGEVYARFINPTLAIVLQAMQWLDRFEVLQNVIARSMAQEPVRALS